MKKKILLLPLLLLTSCSQKKTIENLQPYFGTYVSVKMSGGSTSIMENVFNIFSEYDSLSDAYNLKTDKNLDQVINIAYLNSDTSEGKEIEVDPRLASLLSFGLQMQEKTSFVLNGEKQYLFNPLIGKISTLWKNFIQHNQPLPDDATLKTLLEEVNQSSLTVNGNKVKRTGKAKIDVGAFAKGYAVKIAQDYLKKEGVRDYYIDGGSSSLGIGSYNDAYPYKIKMTSLLNQGYSEAYFFAKDTSVGTSGSNQQGKEYRGEMYSHIVDPRNGSGKANCDTVTIRCDDAGVADILSTVIFIGGEEAAKALKETFSFEYMIFDGENVVASPDMGFVAEK